MELWVAGIVSFLWLLFILNRIQLPERICRSLIFVCLGFKRDGKWQIGFVRIGPSDKDDSLFYNGVFCFRLTVPFGFGFGIRWAGSNPKAREFMHTWFGSKLNGEISFEFRVQSDESSSAGFTGPNYGQAYGWNEGTK